MVGSLSRFFRNRRIKPKRSHNKKNKDYYYAGNSNRTAKTTLFNDTTKTTLISTSTIALQKAITEEYIPQISDILMKYRIIRKPLDFAVRKGKSHYICDLKLKTYLSSIKNNNSPKDEKLIETLETLSDVDEQKIDLDLYPLTRYVKDRICVTNKCSELCTKYDSCRFIRFTRECMYSGY